MSGLNILRFLAENPGLDLIHAIEKAFEEGQKDAYTNMHTMLTARAFKIGKGLFIDINDLDDIMNILNEKEDDRYGST